MSNKEKFWYMVGPVLLSFVYALTSPIIHVYFVSLISPRVMAIAALISTGLAAIVNYTITVDKFKEWYQRHFLFIVVSDIIIFCLVSFTSINMPEIRFLGFAFINAVSTCLWVMVMKNLVNNIISDGDERTKFDALNNYTCLCASFLGAILAIIFVEIPVEYCIAAQCVVNFIMGCTDYYSFKMLNKKL